MIDSDKLQRFTCEFRGYDSPAAETWFIGMEEGGRRTE